jgi:hypothetical protein
LMLAYITGGIGIGLVPVLALQDVERTRVAIEPADVPVTPVRVVSRPTARRTPVATQFITALETQGRRVAQRRGRPAWPQPTRAAKTVIG